MITVVEIGAREFDSVRIVTRKHSDGSYSRTFFAIKPEGKLTALGEQVSDKLPDWDTLSDMKPRHARLCERITLLEGRVAVLGKLLNGVLNAKAN